MANGFNAAALFSKSQFHERDCVEFTTDYLFWIEIAPVIAQRPRDREVGGIVQ